MSTILSPADKARLDTAVEDCAMHFDEIGLENWRDKLAPFETLNLTPGDGNSVLRRATGLGWGWNASLHMVQLADDFPTLKRLGLAGEQHEVPYILEAWAEESKRQVPLLRTA